MFVLTWILCCALSCSGPEAPPLEPPPAAPPPIEVKPEAPVHKDTATPRQGPNRAPVVELFRIQPSEVYTDSDLRLKLQVSDPDGDVLLTDRAWFCNGRRLSGELGRGLRSDFFQRGDVIQAVVNIDDGTRTMEARSDEVIVLNSPPTIHNRPSDLKQIDGFQLRVSDADEDKLSFSLSGAPSALSIDGSGRLHYLGSTSDPAGDYSVIIRVDDGEGGFAEWNFTMAVAAGSEAHGQEEGGP